MLIDKVGAACKILSMIILSSVLMVYSAQAQGSGSLRGRVIDKETREPLVGASIIIENTSLGIATDINGKFYLPIVPVGKWIVKVTYIGYIQGTREITVAEKSELVEEDIKLSPQALVGEAVVVTAQAKGQMEAINQQLSANKIVNVVSEDKIRELPDFNAAEAIGRLPGVTTQRSSGEASKVVIRGIEPKYNLVAVDGVDLGATGNSGGIQINPQFPSGPYQDRSVDISNISPTMLQSIEVYKTLTPDMDGDAIGGYVNMKLREAPSGFHSDLMWQSGYVKKSGKYDNYKAMASMSDRFFDDVLGAYVLVNAESYDRSADFFDAGYAKQAAASGSDLNPLHGTAPVKLTYFRLRRHDETRSRLGANLILDYKLTNGVLKLVNMFSRLKSDGTDYSTQFNNDQTLNFNLTDGVGTTDAMTNTFQVENNFGFIVMDASVSNSYSKNFNPNIYGFTFRMENAFNQQIPDNTPPEQIFPNIIVNQSKNWLQYLSDGRYDFQENAQVGQLNLKIPFNVGSITSGYFKLGGKARYTHRANDQDLPYGQVFYGGSQTFINAIGAQFPFLARDPLNTTNAPRFFGTDFSNSDQGISHNILDNKFGDLIWVPTTAVLEQMVNFVEGRPDLIDPSGSSWVPGPYQNNINDYDYLERRYAGYLMSELNFWQNLTMVGGVRYEEERSDFTAYRIKDNGNPLNQSFIKATVFPRNHFLLPMVQAKFNPLGWMDLRYSYTQTISRPDFTSMSPYMNSDKNAQYINAGNPDLIPAESFNHDAMITLHDNYLGLFSVGVFYKTIEHFVYGISYKLNPDSLLGSNRAIYKPAAYFADVYPLVGTTTVSMNINNPNNAFLRGVEVDWQTRFWYLPFPLNGIVLGINYTHIKSETSYPVVFIDNLKVPGVKPGTYKSIPYSRDTVRAGRLISQPDDILNASFGYDYKGFSGRISFLYQGEVVQYVSQVPETDSYTEPYFRIDASLRQELPWYGIQLYLDINNINERADISRQKSFSGATSEQFYGMTADVGVRIRI